MTHGATFLKGNYELPRGPVKLSRERWEMLRRAKTAGPLTIDSLVSVTTANRLGSLTVERPMEIDGVIFLPAEYVPEQACAI